MRRMSRLMSTQQTTMSEDHRADSSAEITLINETITDSNTTLRIDSSKSQPTSQTPLEASQITNISHITGSNSQVSSNEKTHSNESSTVEKPIAKEKEKKKRKTVRFEEKTLLINEDNQINEADLKPEKSHLAISMFFF